MNLDVFVKRGKYELRKITDQFVNRKQKEKNMFTNLGTCNVERE